MTGFTNHVFALMHLLGFRFAPRIRDLADIGVRQQVKDGLDRASRLVLTEALPRLAAAGVGLRGVKLDTVWVCWVDVLRQPVQRPGDPRRLRLEHAHAAEDEVWFVDVPDRASIVEVE